jgi:hypothetical protein
MSNPNPGVDPENRDPNPNGSEEWGRDGSNSVSFRETSTSFREPAMSMESAVPSSLSSSQAPSP